MNKTNDDGFDPDDLEAMAQRLEEISAGEDEGYEMIFYISQNDAEEILEAYEKAQKGDPKGLARCYLEISMILESLKKSIEK